MIVLASQSGSRKAMLDAAGVQFDAAPAHLDERSLEQALGQKASPADIASALAAAKAIAVSAGFPGQLVLGSDSLVTVAGQRFDKPSSRADAARHLRLFSGQMMQLHSAAALVRDGRIMWEHVAMASLQLRELSDEFIETYLEAEWPHVSQCVGVFRIEAMGVQLFETIKGDQFTILGMPLLPVLDALRNFGELPT